MKRSIGKYLLLFIFLLNSVSGWGQLRLYTRKYLIQDFMSKPTKVVLSGSREFRSSMRQEITALWTITPYEFCSQAEFNKQKDNSDCYFLHTEVNKGIVFLTLSRQGNKNDNDALKRPVTIIALPIYGEQDNSHRELIYMPAFISLIQDYAEAAFNSEIAAYRGLSAIRKRAPEGMVYYTDPAEADEAFISQYTNAASVVVVSPDGNPKSKPRYELSIGTSDYWLYRYAKH